MPLSKISAPDHLSIEQLRGLAGAVQNALVQTCNVPPEDLFQLINRYKSGEMIIHPEYGGVNRTEDTCIIEIIYLLGRSDEQKRALYRQLVDQAVAVGFKADDIMITLIENDKMDWSLGKGLAYLDVCQSEKNLV